MSSPTLALTADRNLHRHSGKDSLGPLLWVPCSAGTQSTREGVVEHSTLFAWLGRVLGELSDADIAPTFDSRVRSGDGEIDEDEFRAGAGAMGFSLQKKERAVFKGDAQRGFI